jgi:hypothetical protein
MRKKYTHEMATNANASVRKNLMKSFLSLLVSFLIAASAVEAQPLEPFGLQGKTVTAMTFYGGSLYAATENDGVYRRYLGKPDSGWIHLGAPAKNLTSIFAFHTYCPLRCWKGVLAGATLNPTHGDSGLVYFYQQRPDTCQQEGKWAVADSGINRKSVTRINALGGIDVCHPIAPTYVTAFAGTPGAIWRSEDRGKNWKQVWQSATANIFAFAARSRSLLSSDDEIWAGGYLTDNQGLKKPLILRSIDSGTNWEDRSPAGLPGNDECRVLTLSSNDTNIVFAALSHDIFKSNDGGKTWLNATAIDRGHFYNALAINHQHPNRILAGGTYADLQIEFLLYESLDGGNRWSVVNAPGLLRPVSSIVFEPANDQNAYIATRGAGVYRYGRSTVAVKEERRRPENFQFATSFPNPFYIAENLPLAFRLNVPSSGEMTFRLFNIVGQEIANWNLTVAAGGQNLALPFDRSQLTGGIYFLQAEWRGQRITRKLTMIR